MTDLHIGGPGGPFRATIEPPGDKSLSHRALVFAALMAVGVLLPVR
mgnify:CR=1 FL=1